MVTNSSSDIKTAATGKVLQGQGVGTANDFSTATYPSIATGTGKILRADGTNWVASTATYPDTAGTSRNLLQSNGTNFISTAATTFAYTWNNVTGASQTVFSGNGYIANRATLVTFTMNASSLTDVFRIVGFGAGGWTLLPSGSQIFYIGNQASTVTTGSLSSTNAGDCVELVALSATQIIVMSWVGNITVA